MLRFMGSQGVGHDLATEQPPVLLPRSCLGAISHKSPKKGANTNHNLIPPLPPTQLFHHPSRLDSPQIHLHGLATN